jgi:glycosyltransferase involved in cell wall biosynthesis
MAQEGYPSDPKTWRLFRRIEERALRHSTRSVFVTQGAAQMYRERYPGLPGERLAIIENGYDEGVFATLESGAADGHRLNPGVTTLLHSGIVYPSERDPTKLFEALRRMLDSGDLRPHELKVRLRASAHESELKPMIDAHRLAETVELAPPIPYREALVEMMRADGLVVLQAANCNEQVPAKLYEYFRCRRPILGLTDPAGDTAAALRSAGLADIARLDSAAEIATVLRRFLDNVQRGTAPVPAPAAIESASRLNRTRELAALLERLPAAASQALAVES